MAERAKADFRKFRRWVMGGNSQTLRGRLVALALSENGVGQQVGDEQLSGTAPWAADDPTRRSAGNPAGRKSSTNGIRAFEPHRPQRSRQLPAQLPFQAVAMGGGAGVSPFCSTSSTRILTILYGVLRSDSRRSSRRRPLKHRSLRSEGPSRLNHASRRTRRCPPHPTAAIVRPITLLAPSVLLRTFFYGARRPATWYPQPPSNSSGRFDFWRMTDKTSRFLKDFVDYRHFDNSTEQVFPISPLR